jgi:DNA-binding transcriptional LysR family regulator
MGRRPGIEVLFIFSQPLQVAAAPGHPLTRSGKVKLAEVVRYPIAMPDRTFGVRAIFDRALKACGLDCRMLITTNSVALTRTAAQAGAALSLTPPFAAEPEVTAGLVALVPIVEQRLLIGTASVCKREGRHLSAAATEFLQHLRRQFETLALKGGDVHPTSKARRKSAKA